MTSIEISTLCFAGCAGLLLGGIFFGGLWWTVRHGITAKQPGLWFLASMIVRMTIVMVGFYWVGGGQWDRLLSCLIGFIAARAIVVWWTRTVPGLLAPSPGTPGEGRGEGRALSTIPPRPNPRSTGGEGARRSSLPSPLGGKNVAVEPLARLRTESRHAT